MTDLVISEGYAAVGYEYINVDDCWLDFARSYDGRLQPDAKRFPRGMADLSEYVSTLGVLHVRRLYRGRKKFKLNYATVGELLRNIVLARLRPVKYASPN